ncbi:hypothetical protein [Butyrivibrio sp. AC2005]|uniref:hypothetical protein n=1 Tax=Butyrivibrio sp. AC2005 TaxID=1280672 RepID=UPI001FA782FF|nr:hypothetical protein [Butyrivibrio sp. AC2005]
MKSSDLSTGDSDIARPTEASFRYIGEVSISLMPELMEYKTTCSQISGSARFLVPIP